MPAHSPLEMTKGWNLTIKKNYKKGCEEMIYIYHSPFL